MSVPPMAHADGSPPAGSPPGPPPGLAAANAADAAAASRGDKPGATGLSQFVLTHKNGQVWIKFSCPCGQRLLFPTHKPDRVGRCGRCGREHRVVGLEKRIATFEKHLHAAEAKVEHSDDGLLTRLLRPSEYADAAPAEMRLSGGPAAPAGPTAAKSSPPPAPAPPSAPPAPDDFATFFRSLKAAPPTDARADSNAPGVVGTAGALGPAGGGSASSPTGAARPPAASNLTTASVLPGTAGSGLLADETVELPNPPPAAIAAAAAGAAGKLSTGGPAGAPATSGAGNRAAPSGPGETGMLTDFDLPQMEPVNSARVRETADQAADRLRPRASQIVEPMPSGLIWAWPPATPFARSLAGTVDLLFPALGAIVAASLARYFAESISTRLLVAYVVFGVLGLGWDLAGVLWGSPVSPGKRLAGIHIRTEQGSLPGLGVAALRSFVKWLATPLFWPLAFLDARGRAFHDRVCGTRVLFGRPRSML